MAYEYLTLTPWAFGRLQPSDFIDMLNGETRRREYHENIMAYFTMWTVNPHLKEPISVADMLEPLRGNKQAQREEDERAIEEEFREILEREGAM